MTGTKTWSESGVDPAQLALNKAIVLRAESEVFSEHDLTKAMKVADQRHAGVGRLAQLRGGAFSKRDDARAGCGNAEHVALLFYST